MRYLASAPGQGIRTVNLAGFAAPRPNNALLMAALRRPGALFLDGANQAPGSGSDASGGASLRFGPSCILRCYGNDAELLWENRREPLTGNPLDLLESLLRRFTGKLYLENAHNIADPHDASPVASAPFHSPWTAGTPRTPRALRRADAGPLGPGWVVFASYDLARWIEPSLPAPLKEGPDFPDLLAAFYPWALTWQAEGDARLLILEGAPGAPGSPDEIWRMLDMRGSATPPIGEGSASEMISQPVATLAPSGADTASLAENKGDSATNAPVLRALWSRKDYARAFDAVKEAIAAGDIYQANLTQRFVACMPPAAIDFAALYLRLREVSPAPWACFLDCGEGRAILSSSPELFMRVEHDGPRAIVETRPIKGTRPVAGDARADAALRSELPADEKERAELTMIVDLERNDLSRVCLPGSVKVPEMFRVESFAQVHHMVSLVRGELRAGLSFTGLLRAVFPGGSITGAPKLRAIEVLHGLERQRRGPYTGSIFALGLDGTLASNILIRTLLVEPEMVSFNVGGGIVAGSRCDAEYRECFAKAKGMAQALAPWCDVRVVDEA